MGNQQSDAWGKRKKQRSTAAAQESTAVATSHPDDVWTVPLQGVLPGVGIAEAALDSLNGSDDGRVVLCPKTDGGAHCYYKWHAGRRRGFYAYYYKLPGDTWGDALTGLADRVADVIAGRRSAIKDTPRPA